MTNSQKAKIICELFPKEMMDFLRFSQKLAEEIIEEKNNAGLDIDKALFPLDFWYDITGRVHSVIIDGVKSFEKTPAKIADRLFSGNLFFFIKHSLSQFVLLEEVDKGGQFATAVKMFFDL